MQFPHLSKVTDSELNKELHYAGTQVYNGLDNMRWCFDNYRLRKQPIGHRKLCGDMVEQFDYYMAVLAEKEYRKMP